MNVVMMPPLMQNRINSEAEQAHAYHCHHR